MDIVRKGDQRRRGGKAGRRVSRKAEP